MSTFLELGLKSPINKALSDLGYEKPTQIQEKAIPHILTSREDLKAFAQTGTGKTAAFSLPILELVSDCSKDTQAIILSPTRELAVQIGNNIKEFARYISSIKVVTAYGGANIETQIRDLNRGAQIVVGTPGRVVDLINRSVLRLHNIQWLVLDEADEMLNMGFKDDLDKVLNAAPSTKQTLLFSATFPREVETIAKNYMTDPREITSGQKNVGSSDVSHEYYLVTERTRYEVLKRIVDLNPSIYAIIFCRTRRETQEIVDNLIKDGYNADGLHGELSQSQRDSVMGKFRNKTVQILVATDVAARGLDVESLTHVINHKLPDQIENYTHRSGRTGRAGKKGISVALVSRREKERIRHIERTIKQKFVHNQVPSIKEICENQLMHLTDRVNAIDVKTSKIDDFLPSIYEKLEGLTREELIQKFISLEFNPFLDYYQNAGDLNSPSFRENSRTVKGTSENMTRFFINIGRRDSLNPAKLIGFINDQNIVDNIEIGAIEILDTFSFFEADKNFQEQTLSSFAENQPEFRGRRVNIEITKKRRTIGRRKKNSHENKEGGGFRKKAKRSTKRGGSSSQILESSFHRNFSNDKKISRFKRMQKRR